LKSKHKLISELISFPDVTSQKFYNNFNKELLRAIGIVETEVLLERIFNACKYLPWQTFSDVTYLKGFQNFDLGVLSNFNSSLRTLLHEKLPEIDFKHIIISEEEEVAKPDLAFFDIAVQKIGLKPSEILYIGDSLSLDIIPALSLGFQVKLIDRDNNYLASKYRIDSLEKCIEK